MRIKYLGAVSKLKNDVEKHFNFYDLCNIASIIYFGDTFHDFNFKHKSKRTLRSMIVRELIAYSFEEEKLKKIVEFIRFNYTVMVTDYPNIVSEKYLPEVDVSDEE